MGRPAIDLTGQKFNKLTVLERDWSYPTGAGKSVYWKCLCDCGNITIVRGSNLKNGSVKSCGCRIYKSHNATHNMSKTRIYREWASIKNRCYNKNNKSFKDYGGRGIKVCNEWLNSFETFKEWAYSNGYEDNLTIERKDVDGDYCPSNCTWIPFNEQQRNRKICYSFEYHGRKQDLSSWCKELNLPYKNIHNRIYKLGWSFDRAISEPVHIEKRNNKNG